MRILFVASECRPFSKTGGLADVASALSGAFAVLGHEVLVSTPRYRGVQPERTPSVPGRRFHFVEHGHAPDPPVARWQGRIEPLNKRLAGGCHLTRKIPETIEQAGFAVEQLDTYYFKGEPKPFAYTFEGRALRP